SAQDYRAMGEEYVRLANSRRELSRRFFTDKALSNFGHIGLVHLMLPNAKIIDARRHPLDCGWSCFTNHFPHGMLFSYRLNDIGRHYVNYVSVMAHYDRVLPGKIFRVVYRTLWPTRRRNSGGCSIICTCRLKNNACSFTRASGRSQRSVRSRFANLYTKAVPNGSPMSLGSAPLKLPWVRVSTAIRPSRT